LDKYNSLRHIIDWCGNDQIILTILSYFVLPSLFLVFYPIVPVLSYASLLWVRPKSGTAKEEATFREAEHRSVVAHAISGCLESPIQIIFQVLK